MKKEIPEIALVEHKTARSVVLEYFRKDYPDITEKELLKKETEFTVLVDEEFEEWEDAATVADLLKTVRRQHLWGFCAHTDDPKYKEIHYWIGKKAETIKVLELFSHEIAHAIGYKSENMAKKYAGVSIFAYHIMKEKLKWKKW